MGHGYWLAAAIFLLSTASAYEPFLLKNKVIEATVALAGGRVMDLNRPGEANLLKSNHAYLQNLGSTPVAVPFAGDAPWFEVNGHTVWLAPQQGWWAQQAIHPERQADMWPPDPFLVVADYEVVEANSSRVVLRSPESPISGVQLTKTVELAEDGMLFAVEMKNIRPTSVQWGIWLNTRFDFEPNVNCYVETAQVPRLADCVGDPLLTTFRDEAFNFTMKPDCAVLSSSKAHIVPKNAYAAVFRDGTMLLLEYMPQRADEVAPGHQPIEIYARQDPNPEGRLLELEAHFTWVRLEPGESFRAWVRWRVYPYPGDASREEQLRFFRKKITELNSSC